jgi:hypothetical protein
VWTHAAGDPDGFGTGGQSVSRPLMRRLVFKLSSRVAAPFQFLILALWGTKLGQYRRWCGGGRGAGRWVFALGDSLRAERRGSLPALVTGRFCERLNLRRRAPRVLARHQALAAGREEPAISSSVLASSFNHLVGAGEQRRRYVEAECPRGFQIDHRTKRGQYTRRGLLPTLSTHSSVEAGRSLPSAGLAQPNRPQDSVGPPTS